MGGKIECYLDIASYYSYIAFVQLQQNRELLNENGVEIEIHPFLIGGVNAASGNSPPWLVPAKARYSKYDTRRAAAALGLKDVSVPGDLMEMGKTLLPMRAMTYIKAAFPAAVYTAAFGYLFHAFWTLHKVPNGAPVLREVLSEIPAGFSLASLSLSLPRDASAAGTGTGTGAERLFTPEQVARVLDAVALAEVKGALKARVDEALARGAFGAPWIWATDARGRGEPFFGSDRWHCVYDFLGLPYRKMELLPPPPPPQQQQQKKAKL
ncbi:putative DSBA-like thioredoxin domain-containing protein [Rosellinia necatrix]|uniref:Putative DSBA-like thioredoxin domain-containing protein n=1 Tax=Rosellinia necatrix TaxID=77044 RepID=A0A1W2THD7_ROSNE|nr:putative DSBA-like thioredoxin domain-containing protein [Rosellinia necatrix]